MEKEIKKIIDEKIRNKEIIFTANILNIFLLKIEDNILQKEAEEIEKKIEKYLTNDERLIELFNGKYGEKEYIKEICKGTDESQYKSILEDKYFCFFKELNIKEIRKLYQEEKIENEEDTNLEKRSKDNDIKLEKDDNDVTLEVNEEKTIRFSTILSFGLNNGYVTSDMLQKIDYSQEEDLYDSSEMLEKLEEKGIEIR